MGTRLTSPFDGAVIEAHDDLVARYVEAGWVKKASAKSSDEGEAAEAEKPTAKRSAAKKS